MISENGSAKETPMVNAASDDDAIRVIMQARDEARRRAKKCKKVGDQRNHDYYRGVRDTWDFLLTGMKANKRDGNDGRKVDCRA